MRSMPTVGFERPGARASEMFRLGHFSKTLGPREEGSEAESEKSRDSAELSEDETSEMSEFDVCFSERVAVFYA